jgi:putative lipoprotein
LLARRGRVGTISRSTPTTLIEDDPMRGGLLLLALGLLASAFPAPAQEKKEPTKLTGTVDCKAKPDLPEGSVATVSLQDTSLADAPARTIARQKIEKPGKFPIEFAVEYDPAVINMKNRYTVNVRIEAAGKLVFINDTAFPVLTRGGPAKDVKVEVIDLRKK